MRLVKQITVERATVGELRVSVRPDECLGASCVYVASRRIGYALPNVEYPDALRVVSLRLSSGEHYVLSERPLDVGTLATRSRFCFRSNLFQQLERGRVVVECEYNEYSRKTYRHYAVEDVWHNVPAQEALRVTSVLRTSIHPSWHVRVVERTGFRYLGDNAVERKSLSLTFDDACALKQGDVLHQEWQDVLARREVLVERWGYAHTWSVRRLDLSQEEARRRYNEFVRHRAETPTCGQRCHIGDKEPRALELIELVTDGTIAFPVERPVGNGGWHKWPDIRFASAISAVNWGLMLRAIEGKYFDGVNTLERLKQTVATRCTIERDPERIERVQHSLLAGACFDGHELDNDFDIQVGVGERLLFSGRVDGRPVWIVDSPNWGHALYVFDQETPARDFANHRITAAEAQQDCAARVIHAGAWEVRASSALRTQATP